VGDKGAATKAKRQRIGDEGSLGGDGFGLSLRFLGFGFMRGRESFFEGMRAFFLKE